MYIQLTNIDADTKILCTQEPMRTGPALPDIKGFQYIFSNESMYPLPLNADGSYKELPLYYGICDDDADVNLTGVVKTMTELAFNSEKQNEYLARKSYPSWIGDLATMSWSPPVAYPQDGNFYQWDEPTVSWTLVNQQ